MSLNALRTCVYLLWHSLVQKFLYIHISFHLHGQQSCHLSLLAHFHIRIKGQAPALFQFHLLSYGSNGLNKELCLKSDVTEQFTATHGGGIIALPCHFPFSLFIWLPQRFEFSAQVHRFHRRQLYGVNWIIYEYNK